MMKIKQILERKLIRDGLLLLSSKGITTMLGFCSMIIYGSVFSKVDIAVISIYEMITTLIYSFGFSWTGIGVIRFGREEYESTGKLNVASSIRIHIFGSLFVLCIMILFAMRNWVVNYIGLGSSWTIMLVISHISLLLFHDHITQLSTAMEKHKNNVIYNIGTSLSKVIILILFTSGITKINIMTYLSFNIMASLLLIFIRISRISTSHYLPLIIKIPTQKYINYIKFVSPQFLGFVGLYIIHWADTIVIKANCESSSLGAYSYVHSLFFKIAAISIIITHLFFPKILSWKKSGHKVIKYLQYMPIILVAGMGLFSLLVNALFPIIFNHVFGNKFTLAYSSFRVMLFVLPMYMGIHALVPIINAYDKVLHFQLLIIIASIINLAVDLILIPNIGIYGGAMGTLVSYTVELIGAILIIALIWHQDLKHIKSPTRQES